MNKGDTVMVKAAVFGTTCTMPPLKETHTHVPSGSAASQVKMVHRTKMDGTTRNLWRIQYMKPFEGIITGYSFRNTGQSIPGSDDESGYLYEDKRHKVIIVQPKHTDRWLKPIACLADDLVPINRKESLLKKKSAEIILENSEIEDRIDCIFCGHIFYTIVTPAMIYEEIEKRVKCPQCGGKMVLTTVIYCTASEEAE